MHTILVVDDAKGMRVLCKRTLENDQNKVIAAASGQEALKVLEREAVDLVISDLNMPGIDGNELMQKVRDRYPETAFIMLTGQATIESAIEAIKKGAFDYILKPFNISELSAQVGKCLEHKRLHQQEKILLEIIGMYEQYQEINTGVSESEKGFLGSVLAKAIAALGADAGSIFTFAPKQGLLRPAVFIGHGEDIGGEIKLGERIAGWVAKNNRPLLIQGNATTLPQFQDMAPRPGILSSIVLPVMNRQSLIGVICINRFSAKSTRSFSAYDMEQLQIFMPHIALILTSLRHQQELKELNDLKSGFVSNVSHELRTPIMAISGAAEILGMHPAFAGDQRAKTFLELIFRNTERMHLLVNDLLDFSRLESGRMKVIPTTFDVKSLLEETVQDLQLKAKERQVALETAFPGGAAALTADREKMKQVMVNLIGNAIKFTPSGGWVKVVYKPAGEETIAISVADSGPGIPEEQREKIFEKFYQIDSSMSREQSGFGLGLAIVKTIVEKHRGRVWVESEPGRGSTFFVELPCRCEPDGEDDQQWAI